LDVYELVVEADFAAAHRLREYDGNCEHLHGHNWKVGVALRGECLDVDHAFLNDLAVFQDQNPTTENLARTIYEALAAKLPDGITVAKVTAWESEHCGVSYSRTP